MSEKIYMVPNPPQPCRPIKINPETCIGCNMCIEVCLHDVFMPSAKSKGVPIILYQEECWFCGSCIEECPVEDCIELHHPLKQNISMQWKRRETGETFRLGMQNPPEANTKRPHGEEFKIKRAMKPKRAKKQP